MSRKILLFALSLCALTFTSCKEKPVDPEPEGSKFHGCFLDSQTKGGIATEYHYDDDMRIIMATLSGDTTRFEYDNDGRLISATKGDVHAQMFYGSNETIPERTVIREKGNLTQILKLQFKDGQISKVQSHNGVDTTQIDQIFNLDYQDSALVALEMEYYDPNAKELILLFRAENIITDGKINPLSMNFAITYMNLDLPFAFIPENILTTDLYILNNQSPFDSEYTYNDQGYTLHSDVDVPGFATVIDFAYTCFD